LGQELLAIVQTEQAAETLVQQAKERQVQAIQQALVDREFRLANIITPQVIDPNLKPLRPAIEQLKRTAQKNKARAVQQILREIYAAA